MKLAFYETHGFDSQIEIEHFAKVALEKNPGIVVTKVLDEITHFPDIPIVVTGFRSLEEVRMFRDRYKGPLQIVCWFLDAPTNVRFTRSMARQRNDALTTIAAFSRRDDLQLHMGLREIQASSDTLVFPNVDSIESFLEAGAVRLGVSPSNASTADISSRKRPHSLEDAILLTLLAHNKFVEGLTTTEIAHKMRTVFYDEDFETNKNNVSRYFNFRAHVYFLICAKNVRRYRLSATGESRAIRIAERSNLKS